MPLALHSSTPPPVINNAGQSITSASFTAPAGSVITANCTYNRDAPATGVSVTSSPALTWTQIAHVGNGFNAGRNGGAFAYVAVVGASPVTLTMTASVSGAASADEIRLVPLVLTGC